MVTSNLPDSAVGRPFASSFASQSPSSPGFHHSGGMQGLHNIHQGFNMPGALSRSAVSLGGSGGGPSGGMQQPGGGLSSGRFASSNLPVAMSQIAHGNSHGHSGISSRGGISIVGNPAFSSSLNGVGGSLSGISSNSLSASNRNSVPGLGASPILGNVGSRITNSMGNIVGGGNIGRSISSAGLPVPGLASRVNLATNSGSSLNVPGASRLMGGMLQQAPQMLGMLGTSYPTSGGPLSHSQIQGGNNQLSSMGMLNDINNDNSPFDLNDFPQLTGRPSSAGGPQGQLGSLRKQGVGVSSIVQQSQEFSIQNEDFPALPGFKGGSSDFPMDMHQKEQLHDNVSMMQSQQFPMARSGGFSLGGTYASSRQQQQQQQHGVSVSNAGVGFATGSNQDLIHLHNSELFPSPHGAYSQIQNSGPPSMGLRPLNSPTPASGMGSYEQLIQQYQHPQNQSQFRLQQMSAAGQSYRDQSLKSLPGSLSTPPDRFGLLGLLSVIRMSDPDLTSLALGIDLTTLGLNLNSADNLHKTFGSPWSEEPAKGEPEYSIPPCYYAKPPPPLQEGHFERFHLSTLFYIFYSMPRDEAQLFAAHALYSRGWFYHKEAQIWFSGVGEPLVKTSTYERGTYICFDPNIWETIRKDNFVVQYEAVEKKPAVPKH